MVHAHNMNRNMKNRYRVFRRGWGTYYCEDLTTGQQTVSVGSKIELRKVGWSYP